jgi:hypothetical protein
MDFHRIVFSGHALRGLVRRGIPVRSVRTVLANGDMIAEYADDRPFPSRLLLGVVDGCPIHVVVAYDEETQTCIIVTAYRPETELWSDDFRTRSQR